jgi:hypothetical protein
MPLTPAVKRGLYRPDGQAIQQQREYFYLLQCHALGSLAFNRWLAHTSSIV